MTVDLRLGDCTAILPTIAGGSVDAVITDPPYPEISRDYGRMTEAEWFDMMRLVVPEVRRILKPTGSAVFILQPNSEQVGRMRTWLWEFMAWVGREWGIVQDAYWWNTTALPVGGAITADLMRGSLKSCVWMGNTDCYRSQMDVLWHESVRNAERRMAGETGIQVVTSGRHLNLAKMLTAAERRGGVTPFNVLPIPNANSQSSAGAYGHGAGTPLELADWWTRYICPPGGVVCDPFMGSGTMGIAALRRGCSFVGTEKMAKHFETAQRRIEQAQAQLALPLTVEVPA